MLLIQLMNVYVTQTDRTYRVKLLSEIYVLILFESPFHNKSCLPQISIVWQMHAAVINKLATQSVACHDRGFGLGLLLTEKLGSGFRVFCEVVDERTFFRVCTAAFRRRGPSVISPWVRVRIYVFDPVEINAFLLTL